MALGILAPVLTFVLALAGIVPSAQAQTALAGRTEVHAVASATYTGDAFLTRGTAAKQVVVGGELRIPIGAPAKVPAVVLVHGSGGVNAGVDAWARVFNEAGVAAFILDSFSGRGIVSTVENQDLLHSLAMMPDAYRALDLLAAHPRIRADRIAVMGFSKGAVASVFSALDRFHAAHGGRNRFAAHIGMYTPCNTRFEGDTKVARVPIRMFHGTGDDYVSIGPCRDYVAELKAAGADVTLTEFTGAQHSFDNPAGPALLDVPRAQSTRNCKLKEGPNGVTLNAATGAAFSYADPCIAIGAHTGYSADATTAARAALTSFVRETLLK